MTLRVAQYIHRGFTMSRRAYISKKNNEHPVTHWIKVLGLDKKTIQKMLVNIGIHHTGMYARRTLFYRLPKFHRENEVERFNKVFHSIPPTKKKFIKYMAAYLQDKVAAPVNAESSKVGKTPTYIKLKDFLLLK